MRVLLSVDGSNDAPDSIESCLVILDDAGTGGHVAGQCNENNGVSVGTGGRVVVAENHSLHDENLDSRIHGKGCWSGIFWKNLYREI